MKRKINLLKKYKKDDHMNSLIRFQERMIQWRGLVETLRTLRAEKSALEAYIQNIPSLRRGVRKLNRQNQILTNKYNNLTSAYSQLEEQYTRALQLNLDLRDKITTEPNIDRLHATVVAIRDALTS